MSLMLCQNPIHDWQLLWSCGDDGRVRVWRDDYEEDDDDDDDGIRDGSVGNDQKDNKFLSSLEDDIDELVSMSNGDARSDAARQSQRALNAASR